MRDNKADSKRLISRRRFFQASAAVAAAGLVTPRSAQADSALPIVAPRVRRPNPFLAHDGRPLVAVVRGTDYAAMLAKGMELLGGWELLEAGVPVLIKPNCVLPIPWPYTTDPESILAVVDALRSNGYRRITVADWGAGQKAPEVPTAAFAFHGLDQLAGPGRFKLKDLAGKATVSVRNEAFTNLHEVRIRKLVHQAPLIINMPVLKQHNSVVLTSAMKNFVGVLDWSGRMRMHYGDDLPEPLIYPHTLKAVAEVASAVNPELSIIDARKIVAKHHFDPAQGVILNCGKLILSGDMVAADLVADRIIAQKLPNYVRADAAVILTHCAELTGGPKSLDEVAVRTARV